MDLIRMIFKIIIMTIIFFGTVVGVLFGANHYTNNKLIGEVIDFQKWSQKKMHNCNDYLYISEDGNIRIENKQIKAGFSNCVDSKISEVKSIELNNVTFDSFEEARLMAEIVEKKEMSVLVSGFCDINCLDVAMHSPKSSMCEATEVAVQRIDKMRLGTSGPFEYIRNLKENYVLSVYKEKDVNELFLLDKMKGLYFYESKSLTSKEVLENNLIDDIVKC